MPFKLSGLMLNRVDLCPDGSNPDANIVLFKSKEGRMPARKKVAAKKAVKKTPADTRSKKRQEAEEEEEEEEDDAVVNKADEDDDEDDDVEDDDEETEEEDEEERVSKGGRRREDKEKDKPRRKKKVKKASTEDDEEEGADEDEDEDDEIAKSDDEDDDLEDDDEDDEEDTLDEKVLKTLNPAARMLIQKQNERLRTLSKVARRAERTATIEKERRETLEYVEKAKKDIPNLTGTPEEKGEILKALYGGQPVVKKIADRIVKLLKSGDAAVKNLLMSETGSRRVRTDEEDDAITQLREAADDLRKADKKLTKEQAFEKACQDNPDLFTQYKVEKRRAARSVEN